MRFLPESVETAKWRRVKKKVDTIEAIVRPFADDIRSHPDDLRRVVEGNRGLLSRIQDVRDCLFDIVRNLKATELYRFCDEVRRTSRAAEQASRGVVG